MERWFQRASVGLTIGMIVAVGAALVVHFARGGAVAPIPEAFRTGLTFAQAEAKSKETGKPVLALVTADWCGPCQTFKRGALRESQVDEAVRSKTIAVYVDVDKDPDVAGSLKVFSVPTLVMVRKDGVVKLEGNQSAERVLALIHGR